MPVQVHTAGFTAAASWRREGALENTALDLMFCFNNYNYSLYYFPSVVSTVSFNDVQRFQVCVEFRHVLQAGAKWKVSFM